MKYKWKIKISMLGGTILDVVIDSEQDTPKGVVEEIMRGGDDAFHLIHDEGKSRTITFRQKYVSVLDITPA